MIQMTHQRMNGCILYVITAQQAKQSEVQEDNIYDPQTEGATFVTITSMEPGPILPPFNLANTSCAMLNPAPAESMANGNHDRDRNPIRRVCDVPALAIVRRVERDVEGA